MLRMIMTVTGKGFPLSTFFNGMGIYEITENIDNISLVILLPVNRAGKLRADYKRNGKFFGSELDDNWGTLTSVTSSIEKKRIINYNFKDVDVTLNYVLNRISEEEKIFYKDESVQEEFKKDWEIFKQI